MVLPDKAAKDIEPNWFVDDGSEEFGAIRVADEILVDVMFNSCGETYETLKQHQQTIEIDDIQIQTIDLEGLLKTKQSMRDKDVGDRRVLERALEALNSGRLKPPKAF